LDHANYSLTAAEFNEALTYHHQRYGKLPYGQPHTILIDGSTYRQFGHREEAPWLTMHAVGNVPRNHGLYPMLEEIFALEPPYPAANLEPYYPGWDNVFHNTVAGERPTPNSERDNYFARAQMYGSVLSGGLAGHLYGTGAYDGTTTGEVRQAHERPYIWDALNYPSGGQLQYLGKFLLSAGSAYQKCEPQKELLIPHKAKNAPEDGLDGWAFLLIAPSKDLGFLYFENQAQVPQITGLIPDQVYTLAWFDPIVGNWLPTLKQPADELGTLRVSSFPDDTMIASRDWCLKVTCEMKAR
jgi:hypothetical protein